MGHVDGSTILSAGAINAQATIAADHIEAIGTDLQVMSAAFELVDAFESNAGPLFMSGPTAVGRSFPRAATGGLELERALFVIQQGLLDHAYSPRNVTNSTSAFDGIAYQTADYFPGEVTATIDPNEVHAALVDASQPEVWGNPVAYAELHARRPTGIYLAPGEVATVYVPDELVDSDYNIRVGAQSWDLSNKDEVSRLDRVSLVYPITCSQMKVVSPLGGALYIEVPYLADAGLVYVQVTNAVRSPFFSARSFDRTTLEEWQNTERLHGAPWTDFESDRVLIQVPTSWIYNFDGPVEMMQAWDDGMDAVSELFGLPLVRNKSVVYLQVDTIPRGNANFPGYPQSNNGYDPAAAENGNRNQWILRGPQDSPWTFYHELGHAHFFPKFGGETESAVNLLYVAAFNKKFGLTIDEAFARSISNWDEMTLDQAALTWMVTDNFRSGNPMNISNVAGDEVKYQHRGHGKYTEIAMLFGWDALSDFFHSVHLDYIDGIEYSRSNDPTDSRILRMSTAAGVDLTPLIHFWGVQPDAPAALASDIAAAGFGPSALIYDSLEHYKTLIPMTNEAFRAHMDTIYPGGVSAVPNNPFAGEGFYFNMQNTWSAGHGSAAQAELQAIIDTYFPGGRPAN